MKGISRLTALTAVLALAVGASTAVAGPRPDDRATHGPGALSVDDTSSVRPDDRAWRGVGPAPAVGAVGRSAPRRPDDRANHGAGAVGVVVADVVRPDDRAWRGVGAEPAPIATVGTAGDGFDWIDAGIGAAGALGLTLLLAGLSTLFLRRQRLEPLT